ncbi:MAG: glycosyltransferase, partial [Chitinophagales bacterium]|nr:glycosyltransferase [Chitinophagales bacterium]MDW8428112.1 glycosyltransferase [Chitinophagales bacterium]
MDESTSAFTSKPIISICLTTYNHVNYIAQAIESVLAQCVEVPWELIIADDCSGDGTSAIARSYAEKFPHIIRYCRNSKNLGALKNWLLALDAAQGEYIAHLDGDDYWTDRQKLAKQYSILQNHPECVLCYTNGIRLYPDGKSQPLISSPLNFIHDWGQLLNHGLVPLLSSCLWRKCHHPTQWPKWAASTLFGDVVLFTLLSLKGSFYFLNEPTVVYRTHPNSWIQICASADARCHHALQLYDHFDELTAYRYHHQYNKQRADQLEYLAFSYMKKNKWMTALRFMLQSLWIHPLRRKSELSRAYYRFKWALQHS